MCSNDICVSKQFFVIIILLLSPILIHKNFISVTHINRKYEHEITRDMIIFAGWVWVRGEFINN